MTKRESQKKDNIIELVIHGETPQEIYFIASQMGIMSKLYHTSFFLKELKKN